MHVGESEVAPRVTVGELTVVDAEEVQHRRVQVVHVHPALDRMVAVLVGGPVRDPAAHAAARHPDGERPRMVVASRLLPEELRVGGAAEFAGEDDERRFEETAGLEVGEEGADRPVHRAGVLAVVGHELVVLIPAPLHDLDEPHAPFEQPPRREAVSPEALGLLGVAADPVRGERRRRLTGEVRRVGDRRLHGVGLLMVGDRGLDHAIVVGRREEEGVEGGDRRPLVGLEDRRRLTRIEVRERLTARPEELRRLERGGQKPVGAALALVGAHHHEAGQIRRLAAQAVGRPRADARKALQERPRMQEPDRRLMVGGGPGDGVQKGDVVGVGADVGKEVAHHPSAPAVGPERPGTGQHVRRGAARDVLPLVDELERPAILLFEQRLVVEAVHVGQPSVHEEPHHALSPHRQHGRPERDARGERAVGEQAVEGEPSEAERRPLEHRAAREARGAGWLVGRAAPGPTRPIGPTGHGETPSS